MRYPRTPTCDTIGWKHFRREVDLVPRTFEVEDVDPNVALVSFRSDLEERLRRLAEEQGLDARASLESVLRELASKEVLHPEAVYGILELIELANRAAHGAPVSKEALLPLREKGTDLLERLEALVVGKV